MIEIDVNEFRDIAKLFETEANFDVSLNFYYDETNNFRKFYINETSFNYPYSGNFVLGGIVQKGVLPNLNTLFDGLRLQSNIVEVKLKHLAKGDFTNCLDSSKVQFFIKFLLERDLDIHYSSINFLYYAIVDIVDSAIINSDVAIQLGLEFINHLKNDLYKLCKLEIDSVIKLFHEFEYPNINPDSVIPFIEELISIFEKYIDNPEFHFGLESLKQIFKESKKDGTLPFLMGEENHVLLSDFSHFYLRPIYLFKNSKHFFDNELSISEILSHYRFLDSEQELKHYSFVDSKNNQMIQVSDIFVGLMGKFSEYINTTTVEQIERDIYTLNDKQQDTLDFFIRLIDKSSKKNKAFVHSVDAWDELNKLFLIRQIRNL